MAENTKNNFEEYMQRQKEYGEKLRKLEQNASERPRGNEPTVFPPKTRIWLENGSYLDLIDGTWVYMGPPYKDPLEGSKIRFARENSILNGRIVHERTFFQQTQARGIQERERHYKAIKTGRDEGYSR